MPRGLWGQLDDCLQMAVERPSHKGLTLALEGALFRSRGSWNHTQHRAGEGGICVWLGRQGALCSWAQVGKYVRQAPGCTHPPRGWTPNAFCPGKKRRHCAHWLCSKGNIPVILLFLNCSLFKEEQSRCENLSPTSTHPAHQFQISCCLPNINESMNPPVICMHTNCIFKERSCGSAGCKALGRVLLCLFQALSPD